MGERIISTVGGPVKKSAKYKEVEKREPEPEPEPAPTPTDVPDFTLIVGLRKSNLVSIADRIRELDEKKKEIESELKELKEQGAELLQRAGVKVVMAGGLRVTRVDGVSVHLSKTKLVELGVSDKIITKATLTTNFTTLKVTAPKEK